MRVTVSTHSDNKKITRYNCGSTVQGSILQYFKDKCPGKSTKYYKWEKTGYFVRHFAHFKKYKKCKRNQDSEKQQEEQTDQEEIYINLLRLTSHK